MTGGGSVQLRAFRIAFRAGETVEAAAEQAGITIGEARLIVADDERSPPGAEAYEPITSKKDETMARPKKMAREAEELPPEDGGGGIGGEYHRPDAARAFKIYDDEIAPKKAHMATIKGDLSDPFKRIKDECHYPRKVLDFVAFLEDQEDAKRDHLLLALNLGLQVRNLSLPRDLVTIAAGADNGPIVPSAGRKRPKLVTVPESDGVDADLAGDDFDLPEPRNPAAEDA